MTDCPKGTILRVGYTTKKGRTVRQNCIKSTSPYEGKRADWEKAQRRTRRISRNNAIILRQGTLGKYGYKNLKSISTNERHRALSKAIKKLGPLSVMRKINILMVFTKNRQPRLSSMYERDKKWIYRNYTVKARYVH
jgi:hypothetical protein